MATTRHPHGVSYDAHIISPYRKLVKGDVKPTDDEALADLHAKLMGAVRREA